MKIINELYHIALAVGIGIFWHLGYEGFIIGTLFYVLFITGLRVQALKKD